MAEAAISAAIQKLGDLLVERVSFLYGVEEEVKLLKEELVRMQCFLKDAGEKQATDERIRNWISEIRAVAHDAEDVVEIFSLKVDAPRSRRGLLAKFACFPKHLYRINKIGEEIASINTRLKAIQTSRERYGILPEEMFFLKRLEDVGEWRRVLSPWHKDKEAVGLKKDVDLLLSKAVLAGKKGRAVAGIVGMGGMGKSTLARLVYNHGKVVGKFDCRAWVVVSREFRPEEIIRELVRQLLRRWSDSKVKELEEMEKLQMPGLRHKLHQKLKGRRYFIVLDDVWENAHWESLKDAFPNEDKASVLLLTSRRQDILGGAGYLHNMKTLDLKESWKLFMNKAFMDGDSKGKCPKELEKIGRQIVEKCEGLPLAITVAGGLLENRRQTKSEWKAFLSRINSHLNREGNGNPSAILELSYHNLPPHLKSCFLCLGFFKEDAVISAKRLLHIWISLGLIPHKGQENMEDVARSYLDELITRNILQVKDMREDDRVKSLHIHDLLRDISISRAKEEICFEVLKEEAGTSECVDKPRHRAVYCSKESSGYSVKRNKCVRSLFYHGAGSVEGSATYWRSFELIRTLEFQDFGLRKLPEAVCELSGLRYLGLRNNLLQKLPSSMGRLKKLQVLDISKNLFIHVPNVVWKLVSLRHLYMLKIKCKAPLKLHTLKNLQTLNYVQLDDRLLDNINHMTNLRKLGIELDLHTNVTKLSSSLALSENLVCLSLRQRDYKPMPLPGGLIALRRITQLKLRGPFALPGEEGLPLNLSSLSLVGTWFDEDPMIVLEKLPMLSYLRLDCAYKGNKMTISPNGFLQLEVLALNGLFELTEIEVGKGGLSGLRRLEIKECLKLKSLPEKLRLISNFQAPR
ncbi:hypothetical protein C2S52_009215 [Perilla frutescens var. hirtella]|nr:hypothetical protein C2S51_017278 [Perilla frutescens var. frutescens]KAH6784256.1 hypothetical protein C2S52_009215 [Perilla frutescens var. hirtella]